MLSYNSQMWRQEGGASWKLGQDVGYGLGWRLQAGSIFPVWYNGSLLYCIFADATGAEYRLEQAGSSTLYTSKEGVYLTYDSAAGRVYFPDGSYWQMGSPSSGLEEDGGTMYPTSMGDTNGNVVVLNYLTGLGSVSLNSSARLSSIEDARAVGSYQFSYTAGTVPHLAAITNPIGTSEAYTFGYGITSALSPFEGSAPGAVVNLALGKAATQSSTYSDSTGAESAGKAVDGNTDGEYFDGSVSVTNHDTNAWWQVDLGAPAAVTNVQIWNMTNACCVTRVSNYWVFISDTPFLSTDTPATLANRVGTWSSYQATQPNPSVTIAAGGATGRYVRIQLAGTNYLNLAEVRVIGSNTSVLKRYTPIEPETIEELYGERISVVFGFSTKPVMRCFSPPTTLLSSKPVLL